MKALTVAGVSKIYKNGVKALNSVSLEIKKGDFFALLGANGAGKTSLIGIITGLVNKTEGKIEVLGHDIDKEPNLVKSMVGIVPQEFNFSMFEKVIDIIVWQAGYFGIPRNEAVLRAEEILEQLGLGDKKNVIARTLSGGMKRRLMIARALVHKPKFLILDEPTAGVDVELRHGMWEYLKKLNEEDGVTILLTTHYLEEVEQMCKNAAIIKHGEVIRKDTVKNLLNSVEKETYLIDTKNTVTKSKFTIVDENTLEVVLKKGMSLNTIISQLSAEGVEVAGIRPRGNRLEDLFLNILNT